MSDAACARYLAQLQDELRNVDARVRDRVVRDVARRIAAERETGEPTCARFSRRPATRSTSPPTCASATACASARTGVRSPRSCCCRSAASSSRSRGWFVGLYFLWSSPVWTVREKARRDARPAVRRAPAAAPARAQPVLRASRCSHRSRRASISRCASGREPPELRAAEVADPDGAERGARDERLADERDRVDDRVRRRVDARDRAVADVRDPLEAVRPARRRRRARCRP